MNSDLDHISYQIIGCAYAVHSQLGPGLLESTYEICLLDELSENELQVKRQLPLPVIYKNRKLKAGYRIDLLVEDSVIVEIKSVEALAPIHQAQLLTYMKLAEVKLGLLIDFNVMNLRKGGLKRMVL